MAHEEEGRKAVGRHEQETGFWLTLDGSPSGSLSPSPVQKMFRSPSQTAAVSPRAATTPNEGSTPQGMTPGRKWSQGGRSYSRESPSRSPSTMASLSLSKSPEPDTTGTALDPEFSMKRAPRRSPPRQA